MCEHYDAIYRAVRDALPSKDEILDAFGTAVREAIAEDLEHRNTELAASDNA